MEKEHIAKELKVRKREDAINNSPELK